jgi:hypothetical protein
MKRGMTAEGDTSLRSRGTKCPSCWKQPPSKEQRAQGRPGARRTHGPRATKSTRQNHRYEPDQPAFPAQWFYGLYVLSSVTIAWLPPSVVGLIETSDLSACVGAPGPHDFAVRTTAARRAITALGDVRPSHPIPNVRDDREPPLYGERDERKKATDLGVRSIASGRDRLARRANYADEACTFASHHRPSFRTRRPTRNDEESVGWAKAHRAVPTIPPRV